MHNLPTIANSAPVPSTIDIFLDASKFNQLWRVAQAFASSNLVPATYRGKPESCMIAFDLANRLGVHPLMLMQNTTEIGGRPGFYVEFLAALAAFRGVFTGPIDYIVEGAADAGNLKVTAVATLTRDGKERRESVTLKEAKADGWTRNSKYQSIPEQMLRKRAAGRLIGLYAPEIKFGFPTTDDLEDALLSTTAIVVPESAEPVRPEPMKPGKVEAIDAEVVEPRQMDIEEVVGRSEPKPAAPAPAAPAPSAAPAPAPAPAPAAEDKEFPGFMVRDRFGEEITFYAKAGVHAQKAIQAEIAKCATVDEIEAVLEHNAETVGAMSAGCVANVRDAAEARRGELAPAAPAPEATEELPPVEKPASEPEGLEDEPAASAVDESLRVPVPIKGDGSVDYAALFAKLKGGVTNAASVAALEAWKAANMPTLEDLKANVPTWAKALSDAMQKRRAELGA
ncbi:hypothetical protein [Azospirillum sp. TSH64]|uniref:hypothetical protein n=1 Tax=Azospirillum sp. TSH64 TaxID=652740 RepID=UPI0013049DF5|nr:hypothetical protein [Azospirillum sp. TSH64]